MRFEKYRLTDEERVMRLRVRKHGPYPKGTVWLINWKIDRQRWVMPVIITIGLFCLIVELVVYRGPMRPSFVPGHYPTFGILGLIICFLENIFILLMTTLQLKYKKQIWHSSIDLEQNQIKCVQWGMAPSQLSQPLLPDTVIPPLSHGEIMHLTK